MTEAASSVLPSSAFSSQSADSGLRRHISYLENKFSIVLWTGIFCLMTDAKLWKHVFLDAGPSALSIVAQSSSIALN